MTSVSKDTVNNSIQNIDVAEGPDRRNDPTKNRHNHTKCTYVKGKGLVWMDGCVCGKESK